jgi:carbamoyltransferase
MSAILGVSVGHDSGAALIEDANLVFATNEERYSRIKNHNGVPLESIDACLEIANEKISKVVIEGRRILPFEPVHDPSKSHLLLNRRRTNHLDALGVTRCLLGTTIGVRALQGGFFVSQLPRRAALKKLLASKFSNSVEIQFVDHHLSHISSSTFASPSIRNGVAISFDASGEGFCSKVALFDGSKIEILNQYNLPSFFSPANVYKSVTQVLGFTPLRHEGKVTGLAAFGNPSAAFEDLLKVFNYSKGTRRFTNLLGYDSMPGRLSKILRDYSREDIAAGVQKLTEVTIVDYVKGVLQELDIARTNLFLSGGLFANVKLNQRILEMSEVSDMFVAPNMGDGGLSLGAAYLGSNRFVEPPRSMYLGHADLEEDITSLISIDDYSVLVIPDQELAFFVAQQLAKNKIVAVCRGRMEFGPRALCNRSILYSARDPEVNKWLNKRLNRTEFMPFAPVIRDVDAVQYFDLSNDSNSYDYMTLTTNCKPKAFSNSPAVVHVDGTARPQVLKESVNTFMYSILTNYKDITGSSVLVNTSFNMHEEPIVRTYNEAIESFRLSGLDVLVLNKHVIVKK